MNMRSVLDISAYLVVGPENTKGRPVKRYSKGSTGWRIYLCSAPVEGGIRPGNDFPL